MIKKLDLSNYAVVTERTSPDGDAIVYYRGIDDPSDEIAVYGESGNVVKCRVKDEVRKWAR